MCLFSFRKLFVTCYLCLCVVMQSWAFRKADSRTICSWWWTGWGQLTNCVLLYTSYMLYWASKLLFLCLHQLVTPSKYEDSVLVFMHGNANLHNNFNWVKGCFFCLFFLCRARVKRPSHDRAAAHTGGSAQQNWSLHQVLCKYYVGVYISNSVYMYSGDVDHCRSSLID